VLKAINSLANGLNVQSHVREFPVLGTAAQLAAPRPIRVISAPWRIEDFANS
jgi:hypothetical protein